MSTYEVKNNRIIINGKVVGRIWNVEHFYVTSSNCKDKLVLVKKGDRNVNKLINWLGTSLEKQPYIFYVK